MRNATHVSEGHDQTEFTLNQRWAAQLVGALVACGVRHVVVAPGSRSTPLALACAERSDLRVWSVIDERSAAFFALGLAKATRVPAVVICTSGTAGAHLLPAVIEAREGATPLVLLTADRPWELHGFGAAQTIDQTQLFGRFVRAMEALPLPDETALPHLGAVVARALFEGRCGPVHFNVPFREPLVSPDGRAGPVSSPRVPLYSEGRALPELADVVHAIKASKRGLIVCGPREYDDGFGAAVHRLAAHLGFPVLAEAASNVRYGFAEAVTWYDTMVRSPSLAKSLEPDVVLRFGGGLTSKLVSHWLDASSAKTFVFADDERLFDPSHRASHFVMGRAAQVCTALEQQTTRGDDAFRTRMLELQATLDARMSALTTSLSEPVAARLLVEALPSGASLVASSSMPIRDIDAFAAHAVGPIRFFSNRGVNGIDGVTSTALGVSAATAGAPTALLIGDVAVLHDLSGWLIARKHRLSLTVVVVNNDGGGIFQFLPVASRTTHFEALFGTPHGIDFGSLAAMAGATLHRPTTVDAYRAALGRGFQGGLHLIEVRTERRANVEHHRALVSALLEGLST